MKTVMISIKPEWVKKILNGEKTFEVRKTKPKCNIPFKCLIYCTKNNGGCGKVVAEFICDNIEYAPITTIKFEQLMESSCLWWDNISDYFGFEPAVKPLYFWHISNVKIYDKPKDISDYYSKKVCNGYDKDNDDCLCLGTDYMLKCKNCVGGHSQLKRPPQSWCYIKEL